jgi:signal transduction histidine kinase
MVKTEYQEIEKKIDEQGYQLELLYKLGKAFQTTFEFEKIIHITLVTLTAGGALGFSRAAIFFLSEDGKHLGNGYGIGPYNQQEAGIIWAELDRQNCTLEDLFKNSHKDYLKKQLFPQRIKELLIEIENLSSNSPIKIVLEKGNILKLDSPQSLLLPQSLSEIFHISSEIIIAPLYIKDKISGIVITDNAFHFKIFDTSTINFLFIILSHAGLAIGYALAYEKIKKNLQELENLHEKLKDTQNNLIASERLASIGKISAYFAHELKNPLVTIGGYIKQTLETDDEIKIKRNLHVIKKEINRLELLYNNFLEFSFLQNSKKENINILDILEDLKISLKLQMTDKNIQFYFNIPENPIIFGDKAQLRIVFFNIILNSIESIKAEGSVTIKFSYENNSAKIEISDDGQGIAKEDIDNIFTEFFTTKTHGIGLGLTIVKTIIEELHQGKIEIYSELGKWTKVILYIPNNEISK